MCQPWVMHFYPGVSVRDFERGDWSLSLYVAMWDFVKAEIGS